MWTNIGYDDILYGDIDEKFHQQIRPDIVWFGEPKCISKAYDVIRKADNLLIVGTSLQIGYTLDMLQNVKNNVR
jgi:NAD-dependent deacetylase